MISHGYLWKDNKYMFEYVYQYAVRWRSSVVTMTTENAYYIWDIRLGWYVLVKAKYYGGCKVLYIKEANNRNSLKQVEVGDRGS